MGVVVRRYIDFLIKSLISIPLVLTVYLHQHPYIFVHFKNVCSLQYGKVEYHQVYTMRCTGLVIQYEKYSLPPAIVTNLNISKGHLNKPSLQNSSLDIQVMLHKNFIQTFLLAYNYGKFITTHETWI